MGKIKGKRTSAATLKLTLTIKREQKDVPNLLKVKRRTGRKEELCPSAITVSAIRRRLENFIYL